MRLLLSVFSLTRLRDCHFQFEGSGAENSGQRPVHVGAPGPVGAGTCVLRESG